MPLEKHIHLKPDGELGIWKKEEALTFFKNHITLLEEEIEEIKSLNDRRLKEWYACRYLLHKISGKDEREVCLKDEYGKPYLADSDLYISMSHSRDLAAVIMSRLVCGIDIQYLVPKITRIAKKFVNTREEAYLREEQLIYYLHVIWGAKECLYKAYGKRGLDLKKQMTIHPFTFDDNMNISTVGSLYTEDTTREFYINAKIINDYVLVYALENNEPMWATVDNQL